MIVGATGTLDSVLFFAGVDRGRRVVPSASVSGFFMMSENAAGQSGRARAKLVLALKPLGNGNQCDLDTCRERGYECASLRDHDRSTPRG